MRSPDRREVLQAAAGACLAALGRPAAAARSGGAAGPALILVQLSGGNDGLSTVVPHGDDLYGRNREATRVAPGDVLRLDEHVGLHPYLKGLRKLYDSGSLAVVQGCGYPRPNRSHFQAMEIWHAGDPRGRAVGEGWIGRLCDADFGRGPAAGRVVHIGTTTPFSLYSPLHGPISFVVPEGYRWVENEQALAAYDESVAQGGPSAHSRLDFLRGVLSDARATSQAVRTAAARYRPTAAYPNEPFAYDLMAAAALVNSDVGARVISVELGGFDTHADQRAKHDSLMLRLDQGLSALLADLQASAPGREALVLVFSEFGRRVRENASRGTDHGAAGPMLLAGARVKGGLHGRHPSLADLDDGDLVHTTDFRSVYAAAIQACFDVKPSAILGPSATPLELVG